MNKATGGNGIPTEIFKILKDDVVKALHPICQQICKTHRATGLEKVSFHSNPAGASRQSRSGPENMHGAAEKENYSKLQQRWGREVQTCLHEGTQSDHDFIQHLIFIQESMRNTRQITFFLAELYILLKVRQNLESMGMAPCYYFLHQITFLCA